MRKLVLILPLMVAGLPAHADKSVEIKASCTKATCQEQFKSMSEDLVAAIDYKAVGPAEATGLVGFGIGAVASYVPVDVKQDWRDVTNESFSGLTLIGLQATKGLPFGLDVGAFYTAVPNTDLEILGGEVRFALLEGSTVSPALALRGSYVTVSGVDSYDLDSKAVDLSLSKGFTLITPYAGVGYVWGESDPKDNFGLEKVEVEEAKAYIGARISLGLIEFTPEIGQVGDTVTYSLRTGFSFSL